MCWWLIAPQHESAPAPKLYRLLENAHKNKHDVRNMTKYFWSSYCHQRKISKLQGIYINSGTKHNPLLLPKRSPSTTSPLPWVPAQQSWCQTLCPEVHTARMKNDSKKSVVEHILHARKLHACLVGDGDWSSWPRENSSTRAGLHVSVTRPVAFTKCLWFSLEPNFGPCGCG